MPYYSDAELKQLGFKSIGKNVKISTLASIYNHDQIEIGDNSRIDDFCVISGKVYIAKHVHVAPFCLLAGGIKGILMQDFSGLAYGVKVFTQSDDYSGEALTNPTIPRKYKKEIMNAVSIERHVIVGTGSIIMPGVTLKEGTSIGAMSLIRKSTEAWNIYIGNPAKKLMPRNKNLLLLEQEFLRDHSNDSI